MSRCIKWVVGAPGLTLYGDGNYGGLCAKVRYNHDDASFYTWRACILLSFSAASANLVFICGFAFYCFIRARIFVINTQKPSKEATLVIRISMASPLEQLISHLEDEIQDPEEGMFSLLPFSAAHKLILDNQNIVVVTNISPFPPPH